ncbi:MAG: autotransporter domain-containing protein, partial [Candidatus Adiutrix sp.]|nr:autotransporter domain-containing protein [Candidatus Adiutrix sp.]
EVPLNLSLAGAFETKSGAAVSPELRLGGVIAANNPKSELRMGFVGSDESTTISGIEPGKSRLTAGTGLKARLTDATDIFLNYDLELRKGYQGHSASAGLGVSF